MGIKLHDVLEDQASLQDASVQYEAAAADGSVLRDVRAYKDLFSGAIRWHGVARHKVWRLLLRGNAGEDVWHHWTFDDATYFDYSDKALAPSSGTYTRAGSSPGPAFGSAYLDVTASTAIATGWSSFAWTVMGWQYDGVSAWVHVIETSAGDVFEDGVLEGSPTYGWAFSGGTLTLPAGEYDDLVLLPVALTEDDVSDLISLAEPFGDGAGAIQWQNPSGNNVDQILDDPPLIAEPQWGDSKLRMGDPDGNGAVPLRAITFSLREV